MKKSLALTAVLVYACLSFAPPAHGQRHKKEEINATTVATGDKIRGPRSIKPTHVNRIRYRVAVKTTTTFTAGPSLALPFIPQPPQAATPVAPGGGQGTRDDFARELRESADARSRNNPEEQFQNLLDALGVLSVRSVTEVRNPISLLVTEVNDASDATKSFVRETDSLLAGAGGPDAVLRRLDDSTGFMRQVRDAASAQWPDEAINNFLADVNTLESEVNRISDLAWLAANKSRVDSLLANLRTLRTDVVALSHSNTGADSLAVKFDVARKVLRQWHDIFADAKAQGRTFFELPYVDASCGFAFDQNKETVVALIKQDRLAEDAATATTEQQLVTVVCSSPFSISGGFGFSTVNEREFIFVPSTKTVTENGQTRQQVINRFGFKNNSSFRPIPLLLLNTRVYERNDDIAVHVSAGAGVDIKTGEAGSDVEFIVGPSISFKRSMFITAGVHIGRVPKLAGGFQLDQEVPEGIDKPPVEKAWKPGFIIAVTFKLR